MTVKRTCAPEDSPEFIETHPFDLAVENTNHPFNSRDAFLAHSDSDQVITPQSALHMQRFLNLYDEVKFARTRGPQVTSS